MEQSMTHTFRRELGAWQTICMACLIQIQILFHVLMVLISLKAFAEKKLLNLRVETKK